MDENNPFLNAGELFSKSSEIFKKMKFPNIPNYEMPQLVKPAFEGFKPIDIRNYNFADYQAEVILKQIKDFEDSLDPDQEVLLQLASFGATVYLAVTDIGYANPSILMFHGFVSDEKAQLIQHVNQLSFLLLAQKNLDSTRKTRRIGFLADRDEPEELE